jgi:hypothetical protein
MPIPFSSLGAPVGRGGRTTTTRPGSGKGEGKGEGEGMTMQQGLSKNRQTLIERGKKMAASVK